MIIKGETNCPNCGKELKYYDNVSRIIITKHRKIRHIKIKRYQCVKCNNFHREIPEDILPYKHYESEIITGVIEGLITSDTLGFEDYPCEMTMQRWRK